MCWAYYPKPGESDKPEPLRKHLIDVAETVRDHFDFDRITKKVSKAYNIEHNLARDIVFLIGLFHDLGKARIEYQREPERGFKGHEFYSAFIIHNVFIRIKSYDDYIKKIENLIIYPIMLHHYAQHNSDDAYKYVLKEMSKISGILILRIEEQCYNDIIEVLNYGKLNVESEIIREVINELLKDIDDKAFILSPLGDDPFMPLRSLIAQNNWFGIAALTGILNEADGKVARRNRKG